jgi:hypothetical protein
MNPFLQKLIQGYVWFIATYVNRVMQLWSLYILKEMAAPNDGKQTYDYGHSNISK